MQASVREGAGALLKRTFYASNSIRLGEQKSICLSLVVYDFVSTYYGDSFRNHRQVQEALKKPWEEGTTMVGEVRLPVKKNAVECWVY